MIRKYPSEVCTGFIGVKKSVIDNLDLDNAPSGMEFSSWFLINTIGKKKRCDFCGKKWGVIIMKFKDGDLCACKKCNKKLDRWKNQTKSNRRKK